MSLSAEFSLGFGLFYLEGDVCATRWVTAKYSARTSIILKQGCGEVAVPPSASMNWIHGGGVEFDTYIIV